MADMVDRRERAVVKVAAALGKPWGRCAECRWPGVLIADGLLPPHRVGGPAYCPGGENPPAEEVSRG